MATAKYVNFNSNPSMSLPIGEDNSSFFSKIKYAGGNMSSSLFIGIGALVLFSLIAFLYYYYYILPETNTKYKPNSEQIPAGGNSNVAELLFFYADWCPHCKTAKPIWNDLKAEYENKTINGYRIIFTDINCSEETAEVDKMMNKYNVEGYPTIKLLKDGQVIEYDAKPSKDTLTQFLNTVV